MLVLRCDFGCVEGPCVCLPQLQLTLLVCFVCVSLGGCSPVGASIYVVSPVVAVAQWGLVCAAVASGG